MESNIYIGYYKSPVGLLKIQSTSNSIFSIKFSEEKDSKPNMSNIIDNCIEQLDDYFSGKLKKFKLKLEMHGTPFQVSVWKALEKIKYGETKSYADISESINIKNSFRAVGNANNKNKITIIVPCHRVIGKSGNMTGYGAGIWRKEWLLDHERKFK